MGVERYTLTSSSHGVEITLRLGSDGCRLRESTINNSIIVIIIHIVMGGVERYILLTNSSYGVESKENCESGSSKV